MLRHAIEAAGLWDRTAVIISSDHGWRTSVWRGGPNWTSEDERVSRGPTMGVPFLLKLPGQTTEICYDKRFNTVVTSRIIGAILEGSLTDPARIGEAIERFEQQLRLRS